MKRLLYVALLSASVLLVAPPSEAGLPPCDWDWWHLSICQQTCAEQAGNCETAARGNYYACLNDGGTPETCEASVSTAIYFCNHELDLCNWFCQWQWGRCWSW